MIVDGEEIYTLYWAKVCGQLTFHVAQWTNLWISTMQQLVEKPSQKKNEGYNNKTKSKSQMGCSTGTGMSV